MLEILSKSRALIVIFILFSFYTCVKVEEDKAEKTPFYKIWEGYWRLDTSYTINGETRYFDDTELLTRISFAQNGYNWTSNSYSATSANDKRYNFNTGIETTGYSTKSFLLGSKSGYHSCYFKIENEVGLFLPYTNQYPRPTDINSILLELFNFREEYGCYQVVKPQYTSNRIWKAWSGHISIVTKFDSFDDNATDIDEISFQDIDFFKINGTGYLTPYFRISNLSVNEITLDILLDYYHRQINGQRVLDKCTIKLKRDNNSGIITVPPFHPNRYSYDWWHNCNSSSNGLTLKGGSVINSNGIDNGCIYINGLGQYAEITKKIFTPITLSFWVKPKTILKPKQVLYSKYKNQFGPFIFSLEQDKFVMEINDGFGNIQKVSSAKSVKEDVWNHICLTVNSNNFAILYINGEPDSQGTINPLNYDADAKILLGTTEEALNSGSDINLEGYLDEFIFFDDILSSGEIKQLFIWHLTN